MKKRPFLIALMLFLATPGPASAASPIKTGLHNLSPEETPDANEACYVFVPPNYTGTEPFGLIVFLSPADECLELPYDWKATLQRKKLILVAPQKAGNDHPRARRMGLALASATQLSKIANTHPARIYVSGFSGGGRVASMSAFSRPDLFSGVVAICGVNFPHPVPKVRATEGDDYGTFELTESLEAEAKKNVRFALITGTGDFRHGNILDIYTGGFQKLGFAVKLIDMPGAEHALCSGMTLANAIDFLDSKR